jgi:hypothetical protein
VRRHLRVPLAAVHRRVDVGSEPEQDAVDRVEQAVDVLQVWQLDRESSHRFERPRVRQPHVVLVCGEARGDADQDHG